MSEPMAITNNMLKGVLTDALVFRRNILAGEDLNDIKQPGIYLIDMANVENFPLSGQQAFVRVLADPSQKYVLQEAFGVNQVIRRRFWWSSWGGWRKYSEEPVS